MSCSHPVRRHGGSWRSFGVSKRINDVFFTDVKIPHGKRSTSLAEPTEQYLDILEVGVDLSGSTFQPQLVPLKSQRKSRIWGNRVEIPETTLQHIPPDCDPCGREQRLSLHRGRGRRREGVRDDMIYRAKVIRRIEWAEPVTVINVIELPVFMETELPRGNIIRASAVKLYQVCLIKFVTVRLERRDP